MNPSEEKVEKEMPNKRGQVYVCDVCGNVVEVVRAKAGALVCCGKPMRLFEENTVDAATEKHVPVLETVDNGILVKVGDIPHPMAEDHYIEWIEVSMSGKVLARKYLEPGDPPQALFPPCPEGGGEITARALCNLHGLWKSQ